MRLACCCLSGQHRSSGAAAGVRLQRRRGEQLRQKSRRSEPLRAPAVAPALTQMRNQLLRFGGRRRAPARRRVPKHVLLAIPMFVVVHACHCWRPLHKIASRSQCRNVLQDLSDGSEADAEDYEQAWIQVSAAVPGGCGQVMGACMQKISNMHCAWHVCLSTSNLRMTRLPL